MLFFATMAIRKKDLQAKICIGFKKILAKFVTWEYGRINKNTINSKNYTLSVPRLLRSQKLLKAKLLNKNLWKILLHKEMLTKIN
jgi:hypothetical protein